MQHIAPVMQATQVKLLFRVEYLVTRRQHRFRITQFPALYTDEGDICLILTQGYLPVQPPSSAQQSLCFQVAGIKARAGDGQTARQGKIRFRQQDFLPGGHIHRVAEQSHDSLGYAHPDQLPANKFCRTFGAEFRTQLCRLTPGSGQPAQQAGNHKQHIHHLTQPVRDFRADCQHRLCTAAEKDVGRAVLNHRVAFSVVILTGGGLAVDVDIAGTLGDTDFRRMVFAYHRTQYGAGSRSAVGADIGRAGQNFSRGGVYRAPDGFPQLKDSGRYLVSKKTQHQTGKKAAGKKGKGGNGNNGNANDSPNQKPGESAGVVDRVIHPCGFIHDNTSMLF